MKLVRIKNNLLLVKLVTLIINKENDLFTDGSETCKE